MLNKPSNDWLTDQCHFCHRNVSNACCEVLSCWHTRSDASLRDYIQHLRWVCAAASKSDDAMTEDWAVNFPGPTIDSDLHQQQRYQREHELATHTHTHTPLDNNFTEIHVTKSTSTLLKTEKFFATMYGSTTYKLRFCSPQLALWDHGHGDIESRGVPVYYPPFAVLHASTVGGMARLSWPVLLLTFTTCKWLPIWGLVRPDVEQQMCHQ